MPFGMAKLNIAGLGLSELTPDNNQPKEDK